jgi:hypothetical protein
VIQIATYSNEIEAQLLGSQLKESGIDHKIEQSVSGDEFHVLVFDDDLEEAQEIMEAKAMDDEDMFGPTDLGDDDLDLDDLNLDELS